VVLNKQNRLNEAVEVLRRAVELKPDFALALSNLGHLLMLTGRVEEGEIASRRAVELEPANSTFVSNLACVLGSRHRYEEALAVTRRAIELDSGNHLAHAQAGFVLLKMGRMSEAWAEFEWRTHEWAPAPGRRTWDGSPLNGASIVMRPEQGFGDTIQFVRYAALLKSRAGAGRVIVECHRDLKTIMQTVRGVDAVHTPDDPPADAQIEIWMMSLPHLFRTTLDTVPADVPYLSHDPKRADEMRPLIKDAKGLNVGLVWAGNPDYPADRERSMAFDTIVPLTTIEGVTPVSLQRGVAQQRDAARVAQAGMINLADACKNVADLAAAISLVDVVVTVDTLAGHLAGALARPVRTMIPHDAHWLWMTGRTDSPWYPTLRLFRQPTPGDWDAVIRDVAQELKMIAKAK
jgi:tetratricopeptide (TPR) repeat protein